MEGFLTSTAGTPPHSDVKVFPLVLHFLEICLYIVEALSTFWSPERDYFLRLKVFPTMRCGFGNLESPRLEEGFILGPVGSRDFFLWSLQSSYLSPECSPLNPEGSSAFWDPRLLSERNFFFSPADEPQSPRLPGICLFWT